MNTPTLNIIEGGFAHCVAEPRGSYRLEGYRLGQGSVANKISATIYSSLDGSFSTISCMVREFLRQNPPAAVSFDDSPPAGYGVPRIRYLLALLISPQIGSANQETLRADSESLQTRRGRRPYDPAKEC